MKNTTALFSGLYATHRPGQTMACSLEPRLTKRFENMTNRSFPVNHSGAKKTPGKACASERGPLETGYSTFLIFRTKL
jgi:hypothetical protein